MAIATTQSTSTPFAKLTQLGDTLVGALASDPPCCIREVREFGKETPKLKADNTPVKEEVIYLVAMPGTTATVGKDDDTKVVEPGDLVRFSVSGFKWGQVIDARRNLTAANGFRSGQSASGDVYTFRLVGWSAETDNPDAAAKAGFTVVDRRIVLRSQEDKDRYVLARSKQGGNTNPAKDFEVTIRRPEAADKAWEQAADKVFLAKPWERTGPAEPENSPEYSDEPF
jgi:hypothetical protein